MGRPAENSTPPHPTTSPLRPPIHCLNSLCHNNNSSNHKTNNNNNNNITHNGRLNNNNSRCWAGPSRCTRRCRLRLLPLRRRSSWACPGRLLPRGSYFSRRHRRRRPYRRPQRALISLSGLRSVIAAVTIPSFTPSAHQVVVVDVVVVVVVVISVAVVVGGDGGGGGGVGGGGGGVFVVVVGGGGGGVE